MIKVQNNTAIRAPLPPFLRGLSADALADLTWTDPALGVQDAAWWPEVNESPPLPDEFHRYGDETLTVDAERKVVVVKRKVVPFSDEEKAARLEQRREQKRNTLDRDRDAAFLTGMPYTFGDQEDVVQTRPQDQINLMGLSVKAQRQIAANDNTLMPFRGLSNITRMLSPGDMDAMAMAALAHIEGIYARSWARKDAVDNAETLEAIDAIQW